MILGMFLRSFIVWLVLMAGEVVHGMLRNVLLEPRLGDFRARQLSVLSGSLLIIALTCLFIRWIGVPSVQEQLAVGTFWVILTLIFEVSFGRLVLHYSWQRIFADYNLRRGGLLPLGMVALLLSPLIANTILALVEP